MDLLYWPTKVVVVDDDVHILEMLQNYLPQKFLTFDFFDNPYDALEFIQNSPKQDISQFITFVDEITEYEHKLLDFNISDLHKLVLDNSRFDMICTLLVDYDMHGMNGIEFCKEVDKFGKFNKVMLTSHMGHQQAVEAFNANIIDQFIEKVPSNKLYNIVQDVILKLQCAKFRSITEPIATALLKSIDPTILTLPNFQTYFNKIINEYQIIEYYLLSSSGCFLMLSSNGQAYFLISHTDEYIESLIEAGENMISKEVKEKLVMRKELLYSCDLSKFQWPDFDKWKDFMIPVEYVIKGNNTNFYLGVVAVPFFRELLFSFDEYKSNQRSTEPFLMP